MNVAFTIALSFSVSAHTCVPVHAPLHPENVDDASAVALIVTSVPIWYVAEHSTLPLPQLIPGGTLVTFPLPVPMRFIVSV